MSSQKHIQDELRSLGSDLPASDNQPFSVPEGYFDGLAATILAKVKGTETTPQAELSELSPLLAGISKQTPYSVPASYFEESLVGASAVLDQEGSAILAAIGKSMPYQVPGKYFDLLPNRILEKLAKPKAKVVPLFSRTWMRVATAAVIGGALVFGGYQLLSGNSDKINTPGTAKVPDTTNQQLARNSAMPVEEIKQVSTKDLEEFIENVEVAAPKGQNKSTKDPNTKDVKELLKDVSVNEMESFLSSLPTADDEFLITD